MILPPPSACVPDSPIMWNILSFFMWFMNKLFHWMSSISYMICVSRLTIIIHWLDNYTLSGHQLQYCTYHESWTDSHIRYFFLNIYIFLNSQFWGNLAWSPLLNWALLYGENCFKKISIFQNVKKYKNINFYLLLLPFVAKLSPKSNSISIISIWSSNPQESLIWT